MTRSRKQCRVETVGKKYTEADILIAGGVGTLSYEHNSLDEPAILYVNLSPSPPLYNAPLPSLDIPLPVPLPFLFPQNRTILSPSP